MMHPENIPPPEVYGIFSESMLHSSLPQAFPNFAMVFLLPLDSLMISPPWTPVYISPSISTRLSGPLIKFS